jgi:hypothetical protein
MNKIRDAGGKALETSVAVDKEYQLIAPKVAGAKEITKATKIGGAEGETEANVGSVAIPGLKPISGTRITNQSVERVKKAMPDMRSVDSLINDIISKYDKMGSEIVGDDAADYSSKIRNLQLLAKSESLYNLGVITGPDLMLLESVIPDPSSIKEGIKKQVVGDISVRLKNFRNTYNTRKTATLNANGFNEVKTVNGKEYVKVPGGWEEQ